jgi:hypothetical protein
VKSKNDINDKYVSDRINNEKKIRS